VHEFAHGIFARLNNVRIKSTGVACLGPFLGAFVEQDDKQMLKASKKAQLAILAAGTFANVVLAALFTLILIGFFFISFTPEGYAFDNYAYTLVNTSELSLPLLTTIGTKSYQEATQGDKHYFFDAKTNITTLQGQLIVAYEDTPAFRAQLGNTILSMDGVPITSYALLNATLRSFRPHQTITIITRMNEAPQETTLTLGEREGRAYLGIMTLPYQRKGLLGLWYQTVSAVKDPHVAYQAIIPGAQFIYDLLWWIIIINVLVALFNMFPAGMLDGGRFFLLTIWGITGSKKAGEYAFKAGTWILLGVLAIMMVKWVFVIV
jgi:membrane-associated protease RseP (regulator of RpoE activity)